MQGHRVETIYDPMVQTINGYNWEQPKTARESYSKPAVVARE